MSANKEVNDVTHDLGQIDKAWEGFIIRNGLMYTPNGYFYPPGFIYSIPIRIQQIASVRARAANAKTIAPMDQMTAFKSEH